MEGDLLTQVQDQLKQTPLTHEEIRTRMKARGVIVSRSWLIHLKANRFEDCGVRKVQALQSVLNEAGEQQPATE